MDLFSQFESEENRYKFENILPFDGEVSYDELFLTPTESAAYFEAFTTEIAWKNDRAIIYGKTIETKRKVAWYGDRPFQYQYSNTEKIALPWTPNLLKIRAKVEFETGQKFNACLLNLYHSGSEGMAWHSDAEKELLKNGTIASISLGAERKFAFKHKKTNEIVSIQLKTGSLLCMKGETQTHWLHRLPPTTKVKSPRINLTFRQMVE